MNLKGHARIELTNVRTGKKEVVEHDNMVTNAVYDLCNPPYPLFPSELQVPAINYNKPLVESLFGGIMLWDEELNDDPDDYVFPHGVGCTGYACDKANAGVNNMMGTYNASESGYQSDGSYKKVWDFSTAQANGAIASLSLVPTIAGNIGWGVTEYDSSIYEARSGAVTTGLVYPSDISYADRKLYVKDGYLYQIKWCNLLYSSDKQNIHVSRNGGKLILQKLLLPSKRLSLFANCNYVKLVEEIEVQLPADFVSSISTTSTYFYGMCMYDDRTESINLIVRDSAVANAGSVIKMCRIKISDFSAVTYDITTPVNIYFEQIRTGDGYQYGYRASVSGSKMVVNKYNSNNIAVIDITDYSFKEIESPFAGKMFYIGDMQNGYLNLSNGNSEQANQYILDVDSAKLMRLEAYGWTASTSSPVHTLYNRKYIGVRVVGSKIHSMNAQYMYPFYHIMLTKNNLDSPVTKTADKTMKITYTIKEV